MWATAASVGVLVRAVPGQRAAGRVIRWAAKTILWWTGHGVTVQDADRVTRDGPVVLVANRAGRIDPLVLAAAVPGPFLIADAAALALLPREARFLLMPLVASPVKGSALPPGGTLRDRICQGLKSGHSVLVLPDGPPGIAPHLSRFRLDALHAAVDTGTRVQPLGLLGTSHILEPNGRAGVRNDAVVLMGQPIHLAATHQDGLAEAREQVRDALVKLFNTPA